MLRNALEIFYRGVDRTHQTPKMEIFTEIVNFLNAKVNQITGFCMVTTLAFKELMA